jgi:hypothetical protein
VNGDFMIRKRGNLTAQAFELPENGVDVLKGHQPAERRMPHVLAMLARQGAAHYMKFQTDTIKRSRHFEPPKKFII